MLRLGSRVVVLEADAYLERLASARARGRRRLDCLYETVCSELGFGLSMDAWTSLIDERGITDVDSFTTGLLDAEGLRDEGALRAQVRARITAALDAVSFMHVTWPDGITIALVDVSPSCDPLHTSHVVGTFYPAGGFDRLNGEIGLVNRLWDEEQGEAAFAASEAIDGLGIRATDELGRPYRLFNVQFSAGLLFSAARDGW